MYVHVLQCAYILYCIVGNWHKTVHKYITRMIKIKNLNVTVFWRTNHLCTFHNSMQCVSLVV